LILLTPQWCLQDRPTRWTLKKPTRRGTEKRVVTVGLIQDDIVVVVVWTARDETRRIISMRRANEKERKQFEGIF
jgi:hypothetical protein